MIPIEGGTPVECGAKARTNGMKPCRLPAMKNGRCCLHGGKCTGAKTAKGLEKIKLVNTKHGFYSSQSIAERKYARDMIKVAKGNRL